MVRPNDPFRARHYAILLLFLARLRQSFGSAPFTGLPGPSSLRERRLVGLTRFELVTPRLSSVCSNQLSYRPSPKYLRFQNADFRLMIAGRSNLKSAICHLQFQRSLCRFSQN